jgi:uncharacterized protein (UPF0147 family)
MSIGAALRHGPSIVPRIRVAARGRDRDVYRAGAEAESRRATAVADLETVSSDSETEL